MKTVKCGLAPYNSRSYHDVYVNTLTNDVIQPPVMPPGAPPPPLPAGYVYGRQNNNDATDVVACQAAQPPVNDPRFLIVGESGDAAGRQYRVEGTFSDRNGMSGPFPFYPVISKMAMAYGTFADVSPDVPSCFVFVSGGIQLDPATGQWVVSTDGSATIGVARLSVESFALKITDVTSGKVWSHSFPQGDYASVIEHAFA